MIFGTILLTSEFLPPDRPLLAALMPSPPTGLVLIIGSRPPGRRWLFRFAVLSVLYASGLFPLLFVAAYLLPGGVAAVINSLSPLLVVVLSVPLLGDRIRAVQVGAGFLGVAGVAMLAPRSDAELDPIGLLAMTGAATMMGVATVLTKRWGRPPGMSSLHMTGWTFLLAGITLLPITLLAEGLPRELTARNVGGMVYLVLISGILAYGAVVLGAAVPDRQRGDVPVAAQSRGRGRARVGGTRSAVEPVAAGRCADRADLSGARPARRVRAAGPSCRDAGQRVADDDHRRTIMAWRSVAGVEHERPGDASGGWRGSRTISPSSIGLRSRRPGADVLTAVQIRHPSAA